MPSPTAVPIELSGEEREMLEAWTRRRTTAAALSLRARIVLACAGGQSNTEIASGLGVHRNTVALWRRRFVEFRLDAIADFQVRDIPPLQSTPSHGKRAPVHIADVDDGLRALYKLK